VKKRGGRELLFFRIYVSINKKSGKTSLASKEERREGAALFVYIFRKI